AKGQAVYVVVCTDDELANKEAASVSKAVRQLGLRIIPADLVEEAMDRCIQTMRQGDEKDPDDARKRLADAFASIGVSPRDLTDYLGHDLGKLGPQELAKLRAIYAAIRDGESTWQAETEVANRNLSPPPLAEKPSQAPPDQTLKAS